MKALGVVLIGMGLALLFFSFLSVFFNTEKIISPVPETHGVRVIMITPGK